ncbi:MAG: hypothetical protein IT261_06295, partial [Saprospiraceae bacterium]|nr:hypothetical protein [Saprospiraceae bacterium]
MQKLVLLLLCWLPLALAAQKTNPPSGTGKQPTKSAPAAPASNAPAPTPATATAAGRDTAIAKLFDKPSDLKWVKYYKGRLDDAYVVDLALGFDG